MTLLVHLGYLTWHEEKETTCVPNEEVRTEFRKILNGRNADRKSMLPALVAELKRNKPSEGAIRQIKERNDAVGFYEDNILGG